MKRVLQTLAALGVVGALGVLSGAIPIAASSGHWGVTRWFLQFAKRRAVSTSSFGKHPPKLDDPRMVLMGAGHYEGGCKPCHGAPGEPPWMVVRGMTPEPPDLSRSAAEYDSAELFQIVLHGLKLTGMPAWPALSREDEVWASVAFLKKLPELDAAAYDALVHGERAPVADAPEVVTARCARCHGADGLGRGRGAFPRLAAQKPDYLRASLEAYAKGERSSGIMQPIAVALEPADLDAVVSWYAGRARPPPIGSAHGDGEAIAKNGIPERRIPACAECHGPDEKKTHPQYPRLFGQYPEYLELQLELFGSQARGGGKYAKLMRAVTAHGIEPEQMRAVASYYAALETEP